MNHRNGLSLLGTLIVLFLVVVLIFGLGHTGMAMGGGWGWILLVLMMVSLFLLMGGMCGHGGMGMGTPVKPTGLCSWPRRKSGAHRAVDERRRGPFGPLERRRGGDAAAPDQIHC